MTMTPLDITKGIVGVEQRDLAPHGDMRGSLTEMFRPDFLPYPLPQWNLFYSNANAMRGMRLHCHRTDYVVVIDATVLVGLHDLRADSASVGASMLVELCASKPCALVIPPGIVHGFYIPERAIHTIGLSHSHDFGDDGLGCRWDDPNLGLTWPCLDPILVERDRTSGSLDVLRRDYARSAK
jgi:dTDP-4-dehydrorhamnose 3,5-epimerase